MHTVFPQLIIETYHVTRTCARLSRAPFTAYFLTASGMIAALLNRLATGFAINGVLPSTRWKGCGPRQLPALAECPFENALNSLFSRLV